MEIKARKLPWQKATRQTSSPDNRYHTKYWISRREIFRRGTKTMPNGYILRNVYCYQCYLETGKQIEGAQTDHIVQKKLGGSDEDDNLMTLCDRHHNSKSAREGNNMRKL
jgi:5-methylcytosine-specific restriction protein A